MKYSILLILVFAACAFGQAKETIPTKTRTDLEAFQEKYGVVVIKSYSNVGRMTGTGGTFSLQALTLNNPTNNTKVRGLVVEVETSERYSSSARSFVEYDEIDSLIKGIDYISKIDKSKTPLDLFEAKYTTKGGFEIVVFNNSQDKLSVAISVGSYGSKTIYVKLEDISTLVLNLQNAKAILDKAQ